jgi:hypothetical protein
LMPSQSVQDRPPHFHPPKFHIVPPWVEFRIAALHQRALTLR